MARKNYRTPHLPHEKHGEKIDRCWMWKGTRNNSGYGIFKLQGENYLAHRLAYFIEYGVDPGNNYVRHICKVKLCCNPAHLFLEPRDKKQGDAASQDELV